MTDRPPYPGIESAIVVEVPAADPIVGAWRERFDPAAGWGVPAHVTVLYPFVAPAAIDVADLDRMRTVVAGFGAFDLAFAEVGRFGDEVLFLRPDPAEPLSQLTDAFADTWPEHPPYGGIHDVVIPHLTVADRSGHEHFDEIELAVSKHLPIRADVSSLSLMTGSYEPNTWRTVERFSLAGK